MSDNKSRSYPLLPKLNKNLTVEVATKACWQRESHDFLNSLAESIDSGAEFANVGHIDSIPDVWARPLLFQLALFDEDNKMGFVNGLHQQVVGEWRSLIAMLALKEVKHLNITTREVIIDPINGGNIEKVLDVLKPVEAVFKDDDFDANPWNRLYMVYLNGKPLAVTSPTTLLHTTADYMNIFAGELQEPWSNDGRLLTDPVGHLSDEEHLIVYNWLDKLHMRVQEHGLSISKGLASGDEKIVKGLLRVLASYRADIKKRCPQVTFGAPIEFIDAGLDLHYGVFRWINYTAKAREATSESSAVKMVVSEARKCHKDILIVSPEMVKSFASTVGVHPAKLPVWAGISANDLVEADLTNGPGRIGRVLLNGAEFRRPEDFFTDKIVLLNAGALVCSLSVAGVSALENSDAGLMPLLPLKTEILEYFTAQELADRLYIEQKGNSIFVTFSFPLVKGEYKYTKEYNQKDMVFQNLEIPVIEIWPNIKRSGWKKYYLYYENIAAQNDEKLGVDLLYVNPWCYGNKLRVPENGLANKYTAKLDDFPEALCCQYNTKDGVIPAGIVLMKEPNTYNRMAGVHWNVGIDFGTSSTMVYYRENDKAMEPFVFTANAYHITNSSLRSLRTALNFLPCKQHGHEAVNYDEHEQLEGNLKDGSTISAYRIIGERRRLGEIKPLEEGHIAWLTSEIALQEFFNAGTKIDLNLKWQNDERGLYEIAAYLKQMCMHIMAEAVYNGVDTISWHFSYPTAFSQAQKIAFEGTCLDAVEDAGQDTGFWAEADEIPVLSWSESKAASYHFNKVDNAFCNFASGAVCLDIGAGTTDISIISGAPGKIIYHTSLQYAGRYFFKPIAAHMTLFGSDSDLEINSDSSNYARNNAVFDARMRDSSRDFLRELKNLIGKPEVKAVLQQSQLAVSGLFYYLGELLATLKDKGIYQEDRLPDIFIGGNGSRIFSWLTGGRFSEDNVYLNIIKSVLEKKSGLRMDDGFKIYLSSHPKIEVVTGMIGEKPVNDSEFFNEDDINTALFGEEYDAFQVGAVMAGNDFNCREDPGYPDVFISAKDMSDGIRVSELDEVYDFVDMFNRGKNIWYEPIQLSNTDMAKLQKAVDGYFVALKGQDPKKIYVEPIFIVAMKQLIDMQVGR